MTSRCGGKGYTEHVHRDYAPDTVTVRSCPGCEDCAKPCATCGGTGRKPTTGQAAPPTQRGLDSWIQGHPRKEQR